MKRSSTFILVILFLSLALQGAWSAGQTEGQEGVATKKVTKLSISTAAMGGGFYAIGSGIADYISNTIEGVQLTAITSGGVAENIRRLDSGEADIGLLSTYDSHDAFLGIGDYEKKYDKMRGMGVLYISIAEVICLKRKGVETFSDLKGRSVVAGVPGGTMHTSFYGFLKVHGLDPEKDLKQRLFLPANAASDALKIGQVDAFMEIAAIPTSYITELSITHKIDLVRFEPGTIDKLVVDMPRFSKVVIPAGTYKGIDEDVESVGIPSLWGCREDLPEDIVYNMVKAVYSEEGLNYLGNVHPSGKAIKLEYAVKWIPIPLHPGAEKFFKEKGLLK